MGKKDMYLYIGKDYIINNNSIVGIFNLDYVKNKKEFKSFRSYLEEQGAVINIADKEERSLILVNNNKSKAYITKLNVNTVLKRLI